MKGRINMTKKYIGYAGTYTRETSEGIYRFVLDTEERTLSQVEVAAKVGSPTYLSISADQRFLYTVAQDDQLGGVAAYAIHQESGELQYINEQMEKGAPPCHLHMEADRKSTRLNSSHVAISYAVFCLKK